LEVITGHYETLWGTSVAALRKCPDKMRFSVQKCENAHINANKIPSLPSDIW